MISSSRSVTIWVFLTACSSNDGKNGNNHARNVTCSITIRKPKQLGILTVVRPGRARRPGKWDRHPPDRKRILPQQLKHKLHPNKLLHCPMLRILKDLGQAIGEHVGELVVPAAIQ